MLSKEARAAASKLSVSNKKRGRIFSKDWPSRFWLNVEFTESCWNWKGNSDGAYGVIGLEGFKIRAHRLSWEIHFGIVPKKLCVCHKCDNPKCIRPSHLFIGTREENTKDMDSKGRRGTTPGEENGRAFLTNAQAEKIRKIYVPRHPKFGRKALAFRYNVSVRNIKRIVERRAYT